MKKFLDILRNNLTATEDIKWGSYVKSLFKTF